MQRTPCLNLFVGSPIPIDLDADAPVLGLATQDGSGQLLDVCTGCSVTIISIAPSCPKP